MNLLGAIGKRQFGVVVIALLAMLLIFNLRQNGFQREPINSVRTAPRVSAENTPNTALSNAEATTSPGTRTLPAPTDVSVGIPPTSSLTDQSIAHALAANEANSAVESLAITADEAFVRKHLVMIGAICRGAAQMRTREIESDTIEALSQKKFAEFEKIYCGDAKALNAKIAGVMAGYTSMRISERETLVETLFASEQTEATANAIINEILVSPDIFSSTIHAQYLNRFSHKDQPLADWGRYMQRYIKAEDRSAVFQIAGELVNCPRLNACGVNQFYLGYLCLNRQNCIPGEDLLAYRRRTTSPMLYQAAEQIAAEMQARRYR